MAQESSGHEARELQAGSLPAMELSAAALERLLAQSGQAMFRVAADGVINGWSEQATGLLGYTTADVEGVPLAEILPEQAIGAFRKTLDKASRGRSVQSFETRLLHKDGSIIHVGVANAPECPGRRGRGAVYFLLQDISERVQAQARVEQSAKQVRALFQTVPDAIILLSPEGAIESLNPAAERMFGYAGHEAIGRSAEILVPDSIRERYPVEPRQFLADGINALIGRTVESEARRRDGSSFPVEVALAVIEEEARHSFAGVVRDISDRKQQEQRLHELNQDLATEVRQRTEINEALEKAMAELKAAQEHLVQTEKMASLGATVAGVAHEINTPLGISITAASMLASQTRKFVKRCEDGSVDAGAATAYAGIAGETVQMLESNLQRAADLVKSFKQLAVDQTGNRKRQFDLRQQIDESLLSLAPELRSTPHRIEVDCEPGIEVIAQPGDLTQILTNLVMNSLIHAYSDGVAGTMRVAASLEGKRVKLVYRDDGQGMSEEQQQKIFEPFFTTRRNAGGTGLGMHIVYNLVHREKGGDITLQSAPGEGAEFTLHLPVELPGESTNPADPA